MTREQARKLVAQGAARILDNGSENLWLKQDAHGRALTASERTQMNAAFKELLEELRSRG